jgi:DNA-binding NarL/FixJ family response regulator
MSAPEKTLVFLVDDHPLVRAGLAYLLQTGGFSLAGQAGCSEETLAHPALQEHPLVIVDLSLGEESGIGLIKQLRARGLDVLVYSMHEGSNVIRQALAAGASGYVTKREAAQSLFDALRSVLAGSRYLSPRVEAALQERTPLDGLSGQQQQIYRLFGRGFTNDEIASQLNISVRTLESYCVRIMDKLGFKGIKELRRQAILEAGAAELGAGANG